MSFERELQAFSVKTGQKIVGVSQNIAIDALEEIIEGTPVETGVARRNWRVRLNKPAKGLLKGKDKTGDKTARAGIKVIARAKVGQSIYVTNNLFYVRILEDGNRYNGPMGFVLKVVNRFDGLVVKAVGRSKTNSGRNIVGRVAVPRWWV
jgi:ATP-dependent exoDNAse (exonuclease V) alpha subunit